MVILGLARVPASASAMVAGTFKRRCSTSMCVRAENFCARAASDSGIQQPLGGPS